MRGTSFGIGVAITATLMLPRAAEAADSPYAAVEVAPARVELAVVDARPITRQFNVANLSTSPEVVTIEQEDFTVVNDAYQILPTKATPWSISTGLTLSATTISLQPKGQVRVDLTYTPLSQTAIRAGALLFTPTVTTAEPKGGMALVVKPQVMVPVLAVPTGSNGKLDSRVQLSGRTGPLELLSAVALGGISFQEPGTIQARSTWINTGNAIGRWDVWTTWTNLGHDYAQVESPPAVSLPGQTVSVSANTALDINHYGRVELTPTFGIITVHATGELILLGQTSNQVSTRDQLVIVAPWRVLGIFLVVVVLAWWVIRRRLKPPHRERSAQLR
jgi:hypothetical protein